LHATEKPLTPVDLFDFLDLFLTEALLESIMFFSEEIEGKVKSVENSLDGNEMEDIMFVSIIWI
jgi:hypothetical protein